MPTDLKQSDMPALPPMGQLRWRCRRGMRELDILLSRFLDVHWDSLSDRHKYSFVEMLEVQDPILMDWVMGRTHPDTKEQLDIVNSLRTPVID